MEREGLETNEFVAMNIIWKHVLLMRVGPHPEEGKLLSYYTWKCTADDWKTFNRPGQLTMNTTHTHIYIYIWVKLPRSKSCKGKKGFYEMRDKTAHNIRERNRGLRRLLGLLLIPLFYFSTTLFVFPLPTLRRSYLYMEFVYILHCISLFSKILFVLLHTPSIYVVESPIPRYSRIQNVRNKPSCHQDPFPPHYGIQTIVGCVERDQSFGKPSAHHEPPQSWSKSVRARRLTTRESTGLRSCGDLRFS